MVNQEKSAFSVTCSLLSQFMKRQATIGAPIMAPVQGSFRPPTTMSLLPGVVVSEEEQNATQAADQSRIETAPLTIFYGGQVLVFDNFPAEKARGIMELASNGPILASSFSGDHQSSGQKKPRPPSAGLPMARRDSLQRFLEKRRERINATAPYQLKGSSMLAAKQEDDCKLRLGLGPQSSDSEKCFQKRR